jgi:hypothetical protein
MVVARSLLVATVVCGCWAGVGATGARASGPVIWAPAHHVGSVGSLDCPSQTLCVGIAHAAVITATRPLDPRGLWRRTVVSDRATGAPVQLLAVSCGSPTLCVATTADGRIVTSTDPGAATPVWTVGNMPGGTALGVSAIDCPSVSLCVAVSGDGDVATSTDPAGGAGTWAQQPIVPVQTCDHYFNQCQPGLVSLSCPSASWCVAIDGLGAGYVSADPSGGGATWRLDGRYSAAAKPPTSSLACPISAFCLTTAYYDSHVYVTGSAVATPDGASSEPDPKGGVEDVWCAARSLCFAQVAYSVTPSTDAFRVFATVTPSRPGAYWTATLTPPHSDHTNSIETIDCPSATTCIATDDLGDVIPGWATAPVARVKAALALKRSRSRAFGSAGTSPPRWPSLSPDASACAGQRGCLAALSRA